MKMSRSQMLHLPRVCAVLTVHNSNRPAQHRPWNSMPWDVWHHLPDHDGCPQSIWCLSQGAGPLSLNHVLLIAVLWGVDFFLKCVLGKMKESGEWMLGRKPLVPHSRISFFFSRGLSSCMVRYTDEKVPSSSFLSAHPALSFCFP